VIQLGGLREPIGLGKPMTLLAFGDVELMIDISFCIHGLYK
jgi:hypothetical protein